MVFKSVKRSIRIIDNYRRNFRTLFSFREQTNFHNHQNLTIFVHLHVFYEQSSHLSLERLKLLPTIHELFITGENRHLNESIYRQAIKASNIKKISVSETAKGMKDTEVFINIIINTIFDDSVVLLKIHGKSVKDAESAKWARRCVEETIPNSETCKSIVENLHQCALPAVAVPISTIAGIETSARFVKRIMQITGNKFSSIGNSVYPAGSMFWANGQYLKHLQNAVHSWNLECMSSQNQNAETLERLLFSGLSSDQSVFVFEPQIESIHQIKETASIDL